MAAIAPPIPGNVTDTSPPKEVEEKVDYLNLPCPIPYEEIHREALSQSLFSPLEFFYSLLLNIMLDIDFFWEY